jgi:probable rRNA maturation factor
VSLAVNVARGSTKSPVSAARLEELARRVLRAERVRRALLSVTLVSDREIAGLNRSYLGHSGVTDVIAFGLSSRRDGPVVGDIYICVPEARRNARRYNVPVRNEVGRLLVHGVLHVLGYTHPDGDARVRSRMWKRQEQLLSRGLPPVTR